MSDPIPNNARFHVWESCESEILQMLCYIMFDNLPTYVIRNLIQN